MKIVIARTAGFCMGVRRAVEMVLDAPGTRKGPICTYGPLIHNPQVLESLKEKGIGTIDRIPENGCGTALIRAHGVPPETASELKIAGFEVLDATCPRVIKVQRIIHSHAQNGSAVIIIGDEDHPEVVGLLGYAGSRGVVVNTLDGLDALPDFDTAIIVAQTTQNARFFETVKTWAAERHPHYTVFDTICDSTHKRQAEVAELADAVDVIIVVGGKNSGNTLRLAEIARQTGKPTFHIETERELDLDALAGAETIGITAGASTPNWIIRRVCRKLEMLPISRQSRLRRWAFNIQRALLLTNIYVSIGAGCLCYACTQLLQVNDSFPYVFIAALYVQSMHTLNHLTGSKSDRYNDPVRANFYSRHRLSLSTLALLAGGAGLLTAYTLGILATIILTAISATGLSYNLNVLPPSIRARYRRIKDIPGSKTVLIAAAWGVVTTLLPAVTEPRVSWGAVAAVLGWATCMVFVRTAFFDLLDIQGDRIVGKETIPILMGEQKTLWMLYVLLAAGMATLLTAAGNGLLPPVAAALAVCPLSFTGLMRAYQRGAIMAGIRLEFATESVFILCGIISLTGALMAG
ncbi:MAG: 4-hydroxy-3-methylbut-2-enyl diphosphate reductase [Pseudomonadota bacterium]